VPPNSGEDVRRRSSRQIEIFNFSFLDILACTIGLLIFIMVMVFILQSESPVTDTTSVINRKLQSATAAKDAAHRDAQIADMIETQLVQIRSPVAPDLAPLRDAARDARNAAEKDLERRSNELRNIQIKLDEARAARARAKTNTLNRIHAELNQAQKRYQDALSAAAAPPTNRVVFSPYKRADDEAKNYHILHVDCRSTELALFRLQQDGTAVELKRLSASGIDRADSPFLAAVREQMTMENPLILFWVRPDGMTTFGLARHALPTDAEFGFEPAEASWKFGNGTDR
jgi:hypothetical protein